MLERQLDMDSPFADGDSRTSAPTAPDDARLWQKPRRSLERTDERPFVGGERHPQLRGKLKRSIERGARSGRHRLGAPCLRADNAETRAHDQGIRWP